jgi:phosphoglycerol transferase MdoB-like AlkP superfamily enzyme
MLLQKLNGYFMAIWILTAVLIVSAAGWGLGYDVLENESHLFEGVGTILSFIGGGGLTIVMLMIALVVIAAIGGFIFYMTERTYEGQRGLQLFHTFVILALIAAAGILTFKWIPVPSWGDVGIAALTLVIVVGTPTLITWAVWRLARVNTRTLTA